MCEVIASFNPLKNENKDKMLRKELHFPLNDYGSNHIFYSYFISPLIVLAPNLNSCITLKHKISVQRNAQLIKADIREETE